MLSTKPVHPTACLPVTLESISHLLLMPLFNSALLQPSLGFVFFLSLLSNPDSHGRAISKQHCGGTCRPLLLNSHLTWLPSHTGERTRSPKDSEICTCSEALYPPSQPFLHLLHTERMSELQETSSRIRFASDQRHTFAVSLRAFFLHLF